MKQKQFIEKLAKAWIQPKVFNYLNSSGCIYRVVNIVNVGPIVKTGLV
jgi:hypothetical protein